MIRVLILHDVGADFQTARGVEQLARGVGEGFEVVVRTIGGGGDYRNVAAGALALRREASGFDLVHAWGPRALAVAAFCPFRHLLFTPTTFSNRRQVGWVRAVMNYRDVHVVSASATARRALAEGGVPLGRCHLIRPGVDFARVKRRRDAALRAELGFGDSNYVLLVAGESTRDSGHEQAAWAGSILNVLDRRTRVLAWGRGPRAAEVYRFGERLEQPELLTMAERRLGRRMEFEALLGVADAIVIAATGPVSTLPIAVCMAAGLPIVATATPTVSELLEDRHTALMTRPGVPRLVSQRVLQLREDAGLQWTLSDMARTEAFEYFSLTRFLEQYRAVYRQASAGTTVEVPEQAAGAGLRFHGRA